MPKLAWIFMLVALATVPATAETAIPDLRGTWKGESETIILGVGNPHHASTPSAAPRLSVIITNPDSPSRSSCHGGSFALP